MERKNELKTIDIANSACYYFDDIMIAREINSGDILSEIRNIRKYSN